MSGANTSVRMGTWWSLSRIGFTKYFRMGIRSSAESNHVVSVIRTRN